jgi:hypothetical protein
VNKSFNMCDGTHLPVARREYVDGVAAPFAGTRSEANAMPVLSAEPLTADAEGCCRLKAVIATDPGYGERARKASEHGAGSVLQPAPRELACASLTLRAAPVAIAMPPESLSLLPGGVVILAVLEPQLHH